MSRLPYVAIVTPIFNRVAYLDRLFAALGRLTYPNRQVVVVDDGSTDGSAEHLARHHPGATVIRGDGSLWWAGATNLGIKWALEHGFDYVLTYNDDQVCARDLLETLLAEAAREPSAILSPYVYYLDRPRRLLSGGIRVDPRTGVTMGVGNETEVGESLPASYEVDGVPGYAMLIPAAVLRKAGPFDAVRFPQIFMELEFCLRARRHGATVRVVPGTSVWNDRSDKADDPVKSRNPLARFRWLARSPKSHLHFLQNLHLARLLYFPAGGRSHSGTGLLFFLRYALKLIGLSLLPKARVRGIKRRLALGLDQWA